MIEQEISQNNNQLQFFKIMIYFMNLSLHQINHDFGYGVSYHFYEIKLGLSYWFLCWNENDY